MITGIILNSIWRFGIHFTTEGMKNIHEVFPAFVSSLIGYVIVSKLTAKRRPDAKHLGIIFGKD